MVKCSDCPCLCEGKSFHEYFSIYNDRSHYIKEWWYCGVDESDIADGNVFRRDVKVKECPIAEIRFKDGKVFKPEVIND